MRWIDTIKKDSEVTGITFVQVKRAAKIEPHAEPYRRGSSDSASPRR